MPLSPRRLNNAPVIEAVLDIALEEDMASDPQVFMIEDKNFRANFPKFEQMRMFQGAFQIGGGAGFVGATSSVQRPIGFMYKTEDEKDRVQFRTNGFTYNRLAPYSTWSNFLNTALEQWEHYHSVAKNVKVIRLGLRYINVINISATEKKPQSCFNISLKVPSGHSVGKIRELTYRYVTEFPDFHCLANVQFSRAPTPQPVATAYYFDIDVYQTDVPSTLTARTLKHNFNNMRKAKNAIFFSTITEKCLENFA